MAGFSDYMEKQILDWMFKRTTWPTAPTALFVSIHTGDPADTASVEVSTSGTAYARVSVATDTNNTTNTQWEVSAAGTGTGGRTVRNEAAVTFATATANWNGTSACTHFGLYDAATAGNLIGSGTINAGTGVVVLSGNQLIFPIDSLSFTVD